MFVLASLQDTVRVPPGSFDRPTEAVLRSEIDCKYAGRVVADVGLCVCCRDIVEVGDGLVYPLEGGATYKTTFSVLVFRPFVGEVVVGTIVGSNAEGVVASLGFFEDVTVPSKYLPTPSTFDPVARLWTWKYEDVEGDGGDDDAGFHLDVGLEMRFRVTAINLAGKG